MIGRHRKIIPAPDVLFLHYHNGGAVSGTSIVVSGWGFSAKSGGLSELVGEGSLSVGGLSERSALLLVADGLSERAAYAPWTQ